MNRGTAEFQPRRLHKMFLNRFDLMRLRCPSRKLARVSQEELAAKPDSEVTVIDVRIVKEFAEGHVPGSLNVYLGNAAFASCVELFVPKWSQIIFVVEKAQEAGRAAAKLGRAGYPDIGGFIVADKLSETDRLTRLNVFDLKSTLSRGRKPAILDVRSAGEWTATRIPDSKNIPLRQLAARSSELCSSSPLVVVCEDGYSSAVAASWLQSKGFDSVQHLNGGMHAYAGGAFSEYADALATSSLQYDSAAFGV
ncbi:MAG TPA: rhodanese-like domain-containing protein [Chthoniobacterales bacterium]|nr:rhodanese-like domain-containing protein [Chthoniobacterales bacterium]